jgi:acetyltransferase-like isoleucine patch superfamily enzyme
MNQQNHKDKKQKVHSQITDETQSGLRRYQQIIVGSKSLAFTIKYEIISSIFGSFPGALGLLLRGRLYKLLLKQIGRGAVIGEGIAVHHPQKISLGRKVAISYGCLLDARGDTNAGIVIGDNVIIGRNSSIVCKEGDIFIGNNVGIGANSTIGAVAGNTIVIGDNVLIAPYVYIGGSSYHTERIDIPFSLQGLDPQGGVSVGDNTWLGANVTLLDGVSVGHDAIIAAGAVVTRNVPDFAIAMGIPAKVVKVRGEVEKIIP